MQPIRKQLIFKSGAVCGIFNTLIQSIKQTPGYKDEYPVAFLQDRQKSEESMTNRKELDVVQLIVLDVNMLEMVNDYAWETYMEMHCGYAPQKQTILKKLQSGLK